MGTFIATMRVQKRGRKSLLWIGVLLVVFGGIFVGQSTYILLAGYQQTLITESTDTHDICWTSGRYKIGPGTRRHHTYVVDGQSYAYEACSRQESLPAGSTLWYNPYNPAVATTDPLNWLVVGAPLMAAGLLLVLMATVLFWPLQRARQQLDYWLRSRRNK